MVREYALQPRRQTRATRSVERRTSSLTDSRAARDRTAGLQRGLSTAQGRYRTCANPGSSPQEPGQSPARLGATHQARTRQQPLLARRRKSKAHLVLVDVPALPLLVPPQMARLVLDEISDVDVLPPCCHRRAPRSLESFEQLAGVSRLARAGSSTKARLARVAGIERCSVPCDEDIGPGARHD